MEELRIGKWKIDANGLEVWVAGVRLYHSGRADDRWTCSGIPVADDYAAAIEDAIWHAPGWTLPHLALSLADRWADLDAEKEEQDAERRRVDDARRRGTDSPWDES